MMNALSLFCLLSRCSTAFCWWQHAQESFVARPLHVPLTFAYFLATQPKRRVFWVRTSDCRERTCNAENAFSIWASPNCLWTRIIIARCSYSTYSVTSWFGAEPQLEWNLWRSWESVLGKIRSFFSYSWVVDIICRKLSFRSRLMQSKTSRSVCSLFIMAWLFCQNQWKEGEVSAEIWVERYCRVGPCTQSSCPL